MADDPLRSAVERLVSPHKEPMLQRHGLDLRVTVITHPGLLQQLRAAVAGGTGSHPGGASGGLDSTRLPFDAGAAGLLERIDRELSSWIQGLGYRGFKGEPERTLVAWYRMHFPLYLAGSIEPAEHGRYVAACREWADAIEDLFNPPDRIPLGASCPRCGRRWGVDGMGDRVDALLVELHREGHYLGSVRATCRGRGCGGVWEGQAGVQALMAAIAASEREAEDALLEQLDTDAPDTGPVTVIT